MLVKQEISLVLVKKGLSILPKTLFERSLIEKVLEINNVDRI